MRKVAGAELARERQARRGKQHLLAHGGGVGDVGREGQLSGGDAQDEIEGAGGEEVRREDDVEVVGEGPAGGEGGERGDGGGGRVGDGGEEGEEVGRGEEVLEGGE